MNFLFAHHDMLDALDILHLHPVSWSEHAVAFVIYSLIVLGSGAAASAGFRKLRGRLDRSRLADPQTHRLAIPPEEAP
jgi:hypothetical protein